MNSRASREGGLSKRLEAGFWSPDLLSGRTGRSHRPNSRSSNVRLAPLESSAPTLPTLECSSAEVVDTHLPSPVARAPSVGHLGSLWGMRHSAPSSLMTPLPSTSIDPARDASRARMVDSSSSSPRCSDPTQGCRLNSGGRRPHNDVRSRRIRRPADFGASLSGNGQHRSHSCSGVGATMPSRHDAGESALASAPETCAPAQAAGSMPVASQRSGSTPPTGTAKADDAAGTFAKARAVAALQRLFFEEMGKGGQDANAAAAAALRRLNDVPSNPSSPAAQGASATHSEALRAGP